jgi:MFS family permease
LFIGFAADAFGRKIAIIIGDIFMAAGCLLMYFCTSIQILQLGRFVAGLGFGAEAFACNIYLAEVCPRKIRGAMVAANLACCVSGQLIALLVCIALAPNWRLMLGVAVVPAVV